jgi:sugar lactone lactonase YvrE
MNLRSSTMFTIALAAILALPSFPLSQTQLCAAPLPANKQKKKKGKKQNAQPESETSSAPVATPTQTDLPTKPSGEAADTPQTKPASVKPVALTTTKAPKPLKPEDDPQRAAWHIDIAPYLLLGSGHPGKAASDFDKPDGVAFTPTGLLLATDAKNRRVHVWDVKTGKRLGEFGHKQLGGEIVDIAVTPGGTVLVTDQTLNLAYAFEPPKPGALDEKGKALSPYDYQFKGTRFGEQGFDKLGGIAIDSSGRIYVVDAHLNEVRRFGPDYLPDQTWKFERGKANGDTYLHGCEGIAIDENAGNLFVASEKDSVVQVFDLGTGAYKHKQIGAREDASGALTGKRIFFGSVEGLTLVGNYLLAVDEAAGHIQIFNISLSDVFNKHLAEYAAGAKSRSGYKGYIGHSSLVDFDDKTNTSLQQQVKDGAIIPGQANPPGYFCSPDAIASHNDKASGETYIAVADQCNYRLVVYRWSDITSKLDHKDAGDRGQIEAKSKPAGGTQSKGKKGKKKR